MDGQSLLSKQIDHLFCSEDGSLRIIDIPLSIALSQRLDSVDQPIARIVSTFAPVDPYNSTEPKSAKAKENILSRIDAATLERNKWNAAFIQNGLDRVKELYSGPWLGSRILDPNVTGLEQSIFEENRNHVDQASKSNIATKKAKLQRPLNLSNSGKDTAYTNPDLQYRMVFNPTEFIKQVTVVGNEESLLNVPACSAFYIGKIIPLNVDHFLTSIKALYPEPSTSAAPGQFDIILMDPPWPNRSVARGHQYAISDNRNRSQDAVTAIASILPEILGPDSMLAIWITNKATVRQQVEQIFEENGICTVEEWIWLKITSSGEAVLPVEGIYRQPWEICIVGRRNGLDDKTDHEIRRKLIIACPDLHSRKPWIGSMLVEAYGAQKPEEMRNLEVFARCTTVNWTAWGEEATKFNDSRWWRQDT